MANLSQQKRDRMIDFLRQLKEEHINDDKSLIALNEIENELLVKKYGLVWEQHEEQVDVLMRENVPVFTEVKEKEIVADENSDSYNFLLEGDNLHSLKLLEKTHRGRVDVIYIDPPYNTGNKDFRYDDSLVDKTDGFSHSKWISFMQRRLDIARNLLSHKGVIFISIDDNEEAALKLLCDEIFGQDCFVANISWQRTYSIRNDSKGIPLEVEHILVYSKQSGWEPKKLPRTEKMDAAYKNPDGDRCKWMSGSPIASDAKTHQGMVYAIQHPFTGALLYPNNTAHWRYSQEQMLDYMNGWCKYALKDLNDDEKRAEICGVSATDVRKNVKAIVIDEPLDIAKEKAEKVLKTGPWPRFYFTNGGKGGIRRKVYADSVSGRISTNYWMYDEVGHTDEAKKEVKSIFNGLIPFDTPKPLRLLERILQIASDDDSIICDFFAGSGTTGHAVMRYNAFNENSNRRFILCTNNENNICEEVTYERIKRVIEGYADKEGIPSNLKYYKADMISKISDDEDYLVGDKLLEYIREMVQLENLISLDNEKYLILLTDEDADELELHPEKLEKCEGIYISSQVLLTSSQEKMFAGVSMKQIPDYYFEDELREVSEIW